MVTFCGDIPATLGESLKSRQQVDRMVDQIEWETARRGGNEGLGRIPALFVTFTAAIYKWERLNRLIRRWRGLPERAEGEIPTERRKRFFAEANAHPEIVEWYVALKLELVLRLSKKLLSSRGISPVGRDLGDDFCAVEWGAGGITHLHCCLWAQGSPRIDVLTEGGKNAAAGGRKDLLLDTDAVERTANYFDEYVSEAHPPKPLEGEERKVSSRHGSKLDSPAKRDPITVDWGELRSILEGAGADAEEDFDRRLGFLAELVDFPNMHDWHLPYAKGNPSPHQSCAKFAQ